ncbi:hypothetical protein ABZ464_12210 [Streptomyces sp. NPDC005820]|uniref:hypothetical protein n=1 Tax=Streptomyces sp. NPDC005820 TaxID=3157069 RepID=UPI00340626BF
MTQGLLLPVAMRWAKLPPDTSVDEERSLAETAAIEAALGAIPKLAAGLGTGPKTVEWLRQEYEGRLASAQARSTGAEDHPALLMHQDYTALHLALIAHRRDTVIRLRDEHHIDDTVLRGLQADLDSEELRLSGGATVE